MTMAKWPSQAKKGALFLAMSPKKRPARMKVSPQMSEPARSQARKRGVGHAGLAGDGRGDGAEAGDELGEEQRDGAATGEVALGLADAGGGFKGEIGRGA